MAALFLHPQPKLWVRRMIQRHMAMSGIGAEAPEVVHVSRPGSFLRVPRKVDPVEKIDSLLGDRALLFVLQKLVLLSLFSNLFDSEKEQNGFRRMSHSVQSTTNNPSHFTHPARESRVL